ncbi:ABC transporter permease [Sphingobium sp. CR28]|uniref:ABC transporter permease n=1 Tax=Sphingobium sp. CR28 TaxID=3400272 RepID=UPI003FF1006F
MTSIGRELSLLAQSWAVQRRVIGALLMREILTRFGRHNIGFLWMFVEPMLFTLGVTALWTATKSAHGSNLPIVAFALTGYSSVLLWRNMPSRCIGAITPNLALMYHRNVKVIDIFAARLLLEGGGATISFAILSIVFIAVGMLEPPEDVLQVIGGWLMIAWFGASLAMLLGALSENYELVEKLWHPASYLLFPLSGAAFLVDSLPKEAQEVVLYLPMVHGVEYVREGYFGSSVHAVYDMQYMAVVNLGLCVLAMSQVRKVGRSVIPE